MFHPTDDLRIENLRPLISPAILMEDLPITEAISTTVAEGRDAVASILRGQNDRLMVVVGPCSIHDPAAAREYAGLLAEKRRELADDLCIVMRVYFEKPRTTVGWKGLINDPDLDESFSINKGLRTARRFLLDVLDLEEIDEVADPTVNLAAADGESVSFTYDGVANDVTLTAAASSLEDIAAAIGKRVEVHAP